MRSRGRGLRCLRDIRAAASGELEEGVDGRFQGAGVPLDLGEEKASLERGEEGDGEGVWVSAVRELPGLVQAAQVFADGGLPLGEAVGQQGPGTGIGLRELAGE
jgi:hypothetical protein